MPWYRPSTGGGGGGTTVHGSNMHDNTVPTKAELTAYLKTTNLPSTKIVPPSGLYVDQTPKNLSDVLADIYTRATQGEVVNENLLFNSTGYLDLAGWSGSKVTISEDDFIDDSDRHFIITDTNVANKFTSKSFALVAGQEYTMSFYYQVASGGLLTASIGLQNSSQVNTATMTSMTNAVVGGSSATWAKITKTFTATAGTVAGIVRFSQITANASAVAKIRRIKIEVGSKDTKWIPAYSDSALNASTLIAGPDATAFS